MFVVEKKTSDERGGTRIYTTLNNATTDGIVGHSRGQVAWLHNERAGQSEDVPIIAADQCERHYAFARRYCL